MTKTREIIKSIVEYNNGQQALQTVQQSDTNLGSENRDTFTETCTEPLQLVGPSSCFD